MTKKKMSVGVKAAWITSVAVVLSAVIGFLGGFNNGGRSGESNIQKINEQRADSGGVIYNNNGNGDVKTVTNNVKGNGNEIINGDKRISK